MSFKRFSLVFRQDFDRVLRRPLFWVLLIILGLTAWGLAGGNVRIASGDAAVGGTKAWLTSEFAQAQMLSMVIFIFYMFFVAIGAGMTVIHDEDNKVGEILHSTGLKPGEYLWGKFAAVTAGFMLVLGIHVLLSVFFNHVFPTDNADEIRGPLDIVNYLRPAIMFGLPTILFFAGTTFAIGTLTKKPILVFIVPTAALLIAPFFLWDWSPSWLDPRINRLLQWIEPSGFRWLNETWLKVDRGVEFYNHQAMTFDFPFILSRLVLIAVALGSVAVTVSRFSASLRGTKKVSRRRGAQDQAAGVPRAGAPSSVPVKAPGFLGGAWVVAKAELKELRSSPGLYLFIPIILIEIIGTVMFDLGAFETPMLLTPGYLAVRTMNTATLLTCLLLLFYTVESLDRERRTQLDGMAFSSPVRTASMLFGKALANTLVAVFILTATFLACWVALLIQGRVAMDVRPFLVTWTLLLVPTFLLWTSFVTALYSWIGNRYFVYAAGLGALILTGYKQSMGKMNWVGNWDLWSVVRWTDFGWFELNRSPLIWNRLLAVTGIVLFVMLAVKLFGRRQQDPTRLFHRLSPVKVLKASLPFLPVIAAATAIGSFLYVQVERGFQGSAEEKKQKDYWRANINTWKDAPLPIITDADVTVNLEPERRYLKSRGVFSFENHLEDPLAKIPLTRGTHWDSLRWTMDGEPYEPEDRAGLCVFTPESPLLPGETVSIGWSFEGAYPQGITKNGGGVGTFILPMGAVLTSFSSSFAPVLGYDPSIGVDEDNTADPKEYPEGFHEGITSSGFGSDSPFPVKTTISAPEEYQLHGVGTLVSDQVADGRRTTVWQTTHPVAFFNIVAGSWEVKRGEGTALYYLAKHDYNVEEMSEALDASRKWFSEWFYPFPWKELKVTEFPALASYAQGFATNITFSESIGFLTKSEPKSNLAFMVTAHEAAHQWWGNILAPGNAPGGNILSEGMAHFSTALLFEQVKGEYQRQEFMKKIENIYSERRRKDSERPLYLIDGTKPGDTTVTYDRGGWVFWMLLQHMGRERGLAGYRDFIHRYSVGPDHALMQDFVDVMREHAADVDAFDAFVGEWIFDTQVPEYKLREVELNAQEGHWEVSFAVENKGTSTMPVTISAERGVRFAEHKKDLGAPQAVREAHASGEEDRFRETRLTFVLGPGERREGSLRMEFEPERLVVDPDVRVLQLNRDQALHRF